MMVPLKAVDAETPAERKRAAAAYQASVKDGRAVEASLAAVAVDLYRREVATVIDGLGAALLDKNDAAVEVWYALATRLAAGGPLTE
ncbi:hypothetical protein SAMN05414139_01483 [Burkholderia sp. D7]|nr:hypothetical protein SAMN05414139_01483 [Burkholderia sp. D7]